MAMATNVAPDSLSLGHHQHHMGGLHRLSSYSLDRRQNNRSSTLTHTEARTLGHQHHHLNQSHRLSSYSLDRRNKYNTLTPLEAKKLSHQLMTASGGGGGGPVAGAMSRPPIRTASVRNKPRPPPMVVSTNLDDHLNGRQQQTLNVPISPLELRLANTVGLAPPDLNHHNQHHHLNSYHSRDDIYSTTAATTTTTTRRANGELEDSFASAKSHQSSDSGLLKSLSRVSLVSTSTYKAFQRCNFKKFFRYMPSRRSMNAASDDKPSDSNSLAMGHQQQANGDSTSQLCFQQQQQQSSRSQTPCLADHNGIPSPNLYGEFMPRATRPQQPLPLLPHQQSDVPRSQSPAMFPPPLPPPRDLKSVTYMEQQAMAAAANKVSYSNYDEFTRLRNQQTSNLLSNGRPSRFDCPNGGGGGGGGCDEIDGADEAWQLTSLPVYFERNLATVFEEKQTKNTDIHIINNNNNTDHNDNQHSDNDDYGKIKPPANFDVDEQQQQQQQHQQQQEQKDNDDNTITELQINIDNDHDHQVNKPISNSNSQSLASVTTVDSLLDLDYHRQVNTSFRFSYAQKSELEHALPRTDTGLPPRMPAMMNGTELSKPSSSSCATTSSDSSMANDLEQQLNYFKSKCQQLEAEVQKGEERELDWRQQVECLKNKLAMEAKKNTDLELKQWSAEHLIGQLKKETAHLKSQLANNPRISS